MGQMTAKAKARKWDGDKLVIEQPARPDGTPFTTSVDLVARATAR